MSILFLKEFMKNINQNTLSDSLISFVNSLKKDNSEYQYNISDYDNLTTAGKELNLGFSCYALKIKHILNSDDLEKESKDEWKEYLCSFQTNVEGFPKMSFYDDKFIKHHKKFSLEKKLKNSTKKFLNYTAQRNYLLQKDALKTFVVAESKQAISTLNEIGHVSNDIYSEFPKTEKDIYSYLDSFDWNNPWSAGAQFSSLCLFSSTQIKDNADILNYLNKYILTKLDKNSGFYFTGRNIDDNVLINGAMKVITGLDWIESGIHYPNKIIDYILTINPTREACDLVDLVYCLYKCSKVSKHRFTEVIKFLEVVETALFQNYVEKDGAFSYSFNKSQKFYYGLVVTKEKNHADLHGTLLLLWAYTLILDLKEKNINKWNIIKP